MKCMKNPIDGQIKRVHDHEARRLARYGWIYVSKAEWKKTIRPDYKAMRKAAAEVVEREVKPMRRS